MLKTLGLHLDTSVVGAVRILSLYLTSWQNHCYTELEPIPSVRTTTSPFEQYFMEGSQHAPDPDFAFITKQCYQPRSGPQRRAYL